MGKEYDKARLVGSNHLNQKVKVVDPDEDWEWKTTIANESVTLESEVVYQVEVKEPEKTTTNDIIFP